jgi:hypothetical protein
MASVLHLHVNTHQAQRHAEGNAGVLNVVTEAVQSCGWEVELHRITDSGALPTRRGHHLVCSEEVVGGNCLNLRQCYRDPFYCIEATNDRWDYEVAGRHFDPAEIHSGFRGFMGYWRPRFLRDAVPSREGHVLVPLQGKLLEHRHFQAMSPIEMIRATLAADPARPVVATLHPKEIYSEAEVATLAEMAAENPRFRLSQQPTMKVLASCDYVVTQNSAVALTGFFADKPAVLFAKIDFHHISGSVPRDGVERAFAKALGPSPAFGKYLYWFFGKNAFSFWEADAKTRIIGRLRHFGWPI